jgi:hypothetical protein
VEQLAFKVPLLSLTTSFNRADDSEIEMQLQGKVVILNASWDADVTG